jgi:hypothetical protein
MGRLTTGAALGVSVVAYLKIHEASFNAGKPSPKEVVYDTKTLLWGGLAGFSMGFAAADLVKLAAKLAKADQAVS